MSDDPAGGIAGNGYEVLGDQLVAGLMPCVRTSLAGGGFAIVCFSHGARPRCACGARAPFECDWKIEVGTCDVAICATCSTQPAAGKDLCPAHAEAWDAWNAARGPRGPEAATSAKSLETRGKA